MRGRAGTCVLALSLLLACGPGDGQPGVPGDPMPFPAPKAPGVAATDPSEFVGSEACAECHASEYSAWAGSTHGRAGGEPGPAVVLAPFDGQGIEFADALVVPRLRGGSYEFVVRQDGFDEVAYRVDGVIGGAHMLGGGTQGFITRMPDGTERFLPWDWSGTDRVWFCNTGDRLDRGWVRITPDLRLADCGDWPPIRPIGTMSRFANCQECHGSQIRAVLDPTGGVYRTEYTTLQVNCESCHGPAGTHVAWARSDRSGDDVGIGTLAYLAKDASLEVCFRCHALKDVLQEGYLPGDALERYYALKFPVLGDQPYFADGRVRSFAYQANHLASACYLQGPMDCVSCHEPHGQGYWDTDRRRLQSPFDDGQCTSCHPSKLDAPGDHTHHPEASEGGRCVSCHMPYFQHPEVGPDVRFARSDHTIAIPRPRFDADLGLVGACAQCHADRTAHELEEQARAWWGELRPHRPLVQGQIDELRARSASEAGALLLRPDQLDPLVQFQALSRLLVAYLDPDTPEPDETIRTRLLDLTRGADLDVRALSLAALHWTEGDRPAIREHLVEALRGAADDEALRGRWVLALGFLGDLHRERGDAPRGEVAYRKALQLRPGDPRILRALGLLRIQGGDHSSAAGLFRRSLSADAAQPLTWVNLGNALVGLGDVAGAEEAYRRALELNPRDAVALFNLGNLHQRAGRLVEADRAYERAVAAEPGLGRAHFELARVRILRERPVEALPHARRAVEFLPDHLPSRQMLHDLERALGG